MEWSLGSPHACDTNVPSEDAVEPLGALTTTDPQLPQARLILHVRVYSCTVEVLYAC